MLQGRIFTFMNMNKITTRFCISIFSCIAAVNLTSHARAADSVSDMDKSFVMKAAQGGMTEVQLGQLATDKGTSQNVKDFGAEMVTDHGNANTQLKSIASSKEIIISQKIDSKHQAMVDNLSGLPAAAFDKAYIEAMVVAHTKDNALFHKEASSGQDADIKAFAAKTDEVVKMHLSMIQDIQSKLK